MTHREELLRSVRVVLLDFDGPVCAAFAGYPAPRIAGEMLASAGQDYPELSAHLGGMSDPMVVVAELYRRVPEAHPRMEMMLRAAEVASIAQAEPTPGVEAFLEACRTSRRPVAIVSNNSAQMINAFLALHPQLAQAVCGVYGRPPDNPLHMKPHPALLTQALHDLGGRPGEALMVGDSVSDIQAAHRAGTRSAGFANRPPKHVLLKRAGTDLLTDDMNELATCLSTTPSR